MVDYTFSKLDLTTMANISGGDQRLWVHLLSAWVISWFVWRVRSSSGILPMLWCPCKSCMMLHTGQTQLYSLGAIGAQACHTQMRQHHR